MFHYVITGKGLKAMPAKSDLGLDEFKELIHSQSKEVYPNSGVFVWRYGFNEFLDPKVYVGQDYLQGGHGCLALIGMS